MKPVAFLYHYLGADRVALDLTPELVQTLDSDGIQVRPLVTEADAQREIERAVRVALAYAWDDWLIEVEDNNVADVLARLKEQT